MSDKLQFVAQHDLVANIRGAQPGHISYAKANHVS